MRIKTHAVSTRPFPSRRGGLGSRLGISLQVAIKPAFNLGYCACIKCICFFLHVVVSLHLNAFKNLQLLCLPVNDVVCVCVCVYNIRQIINKTGKRRATKFGEVVETYIALMI